jgi:predicted O-methyltransferase YrrM
MSQVLDEILRTGFVQSAEGEQVAVHSQIPREEGEFLQKLVREVKPRASVEVGLAYGISSLFICEALAQVGAERHVVIDPYQFEGWKGIGLKNLREGGYEKLIDFRGVSSHLALPQLEAEGLKIDFAFIDGWHTFDYALLEFFYVDRLLRVGGVVVFDDTLYPSVRKVCRYVVTNRAYTVVNRPSGPETRAPWSKTRMLLKAPVISPYLNRIAKPEVVEPDEILGLPAGNYIALRKDGDDVFGDGSGGTRRWDFHKEF